MGEAPGRSLLFATPSGAAQYHYDTLESLKRSFGPDASDFHARLAASPRPRIEIPSAEYLEETGARSSLALLTLIEAAFQLDYQYRCRKRLKDDLSRAFREIHKEKPDYVRLEKDIFEAWCTHATGVHLLIGDLRGAFKFRHWLAHGRYWAPKLGRSYDFESLYLLADAVYSTLPLCGINQA